jgi:polysaccharide export outer membrane protein
VPREPRYYIYGEVQRPGAFRLEKNMSLVQALSVGGGLTQRGTQKGIKILRRGQDGGMKEVDAKLSDSLQTDDVIFVKESLF